MERNRLSVKGIQQQTMKTDIMEQTNTAETMKHKLPIKNDQTKNPNIQELSTVKASQGLTVT